MPEILFAAAYVAAALVAAVGVVLAVAAMMHWGRDRDHGLLPYIFYLAFFSFALEVLLSGRDFSLPRDPELLRPARHVLAEWSTRLTSMFLVFASVERIASHIVRPGGNAPAPLLLLAAFGLYFFTNVVTSAFLGAHRVFTHEPLYALLGACGALLLTRDEGVTAVRAARNALLVFLAAGLLVALGRPDMVLRGHDSVVLPGLDLRLAGLSTHPNILGALSIGFILCLWTHPYASRWLNALGWAIGSTSLVLTQSKTAWIAFAFCAACIVYFRHGGMLTQGLREVRQSFMPAALMLSLMLMTAAVGAAFMLGAFDDAIASFLRTRPGAELLTLTGRDVIWEAALREWRSSPEFGYGLSIWNEAHRTRLGLLSAHDAHNQFYQSLSSAGLAGAAGLVIYVAVLFRFALQTARTTQGLSLALLLLVLVRSVTETPLSVVNYSQEVILHLLMLMVIGSATRSMLHASSSGMQVRAAPTR